MPRPRRWWWVVAVVLAVAVALSRLLKPDPYVASPKSETLPAARLDLAGPALTAYLDQLRASDPNAAALRIQDLSGHVIAQSGPMHPDGTWTATASLTWAYGGVDPSPATTDITVDLKTHGGTVTVTGLGGGAERTPLWLAGPLTVTRTKDTLVATGVGIDHAAYARWATKAVTAVRRVLPVAHGPLVLEVPATVTQLEQALGAAAGAYANVAAETATVDGSVRADSPVHVFANPAVMGTLVASSAQIVLSHEATHALTGAVLTANRPIWLTEGFADYVALRDVKVPITTSAGEIAALVRQSGPPTHLPDQADFNSTSDSFGAEYEAAWLACVQLARDGGEAGLVRVYDAVGSGTPIDRALRADIGYGTAELTRRWQRRLSGLVGDSSP